MRFRALAFDYHTEATNRLLVEERNESTSSRSKQTIWVLPPSSDTTSASEDELEDSDSTVMQTEDALSSPSGDKEGEVPPITPATSLASPLCNGTREESEEEEEEPSFSMNGKETTCLPPDDSNPKQGQAFLKSSSEKASFFKTPLRSSKVAVVTDKKALPPSSNDDDEEEEQEEEEGDDGCSFMVGSDDDNDPMTSVLESNFQPMDVDTTREDNESLQAMDVDQSPTQKIDTSTPLDTALAPLVAQEAKDLESKKKLKRAFFDLSQIPPELVLSALIRPIKNERRQIPVATRPYSTSTGIAVKHPLSILPLCKTTSARFLYPPDWLRSMSISFPRPPTNPMERLSVWSPVGTRNEMAGTTNDATFQHQQPLDAQSGAIVPYTGAGTRLTPKEVDGTHEGAIVPYMGGPQVAIPNEMAGALRVAIEIAQLCLQQQQHSKANNVGAMGSLSSPQATVASNVVEATKPCIDDEGAENKCDKKRRKIELKDAAPNYPIDRSPGMHNRTDVLPHDDRTKSASKRKRNPALTNVADSRDLPLRCEDTQPQKKPAPSKVERRDQEQGRPNNTETLQTQPRSISRKRWTKMCATRHNGGDYDASDERAGIFVAPSDIVERQGRPSIQAQEDRTEDITPPTSNKKRSAEEMESSAQFSYSNGGQHHSFAVESQLLARTSENNASIADKIIYEQDQGFSGDRRTAASYAMGDQSPAVSSAMNPFERVGTGSKSVEGGQSAPSQGLAAALGSSSEERQSASSQGRSIATRLKFSPFGAPGTAATQPVGNEAMLQLVGATEGGLAISHAKHHRSRESASQAPTGMDKERVVPDKEARKEEKRRRKRERKEAKRKQKKERKERAKRQKRNSLSSVKTSVEDDEDDEIVCVGVRNTPEGPIIDAKPPLTSTIASSKSTEPEEISGQQQASLKDGSFLSPEAPKQARAANTKEATMASKKLEEPQNQRLTSSRSLPMHDPTALPNPTGQEARRRFPSSRLGSSSHAMQESHQETSNFQPRNSIGRTEMPPNGQEQTTHHPDNNNVRVFGMAEQSSARLSSSSHAMQPQLHQKSSTVQMPNSRTQPPPNGQEPRNRPSTNNGLAFGTVDQRAPKASNKFASMPPLELICSEKFIDVWAESLAELASGRWTLSLFRGENRQIAQPVPDSAVHGRKILFRDTSLVDCTGVDIELPGGHAIVVHSISNWGADPRTARAFIKSIIRLVSMERFSSLTCVLCIEREISQAQSLRVLELLNSTADLFGSSFVQVQVSSLISVSSSLARIILKHCHANDASTQKYPEVLRLLSDEEVSSRAAFLLKSLPTLTVAQAMLIVGGQNKNPADQFKLLLGSQIERQKLPAQMGGRSSKEAKRLEKAMIQLSCVLKANLREMHPP